jgi:hypothetical protein
MADVRDGLGQSEERERSFEAGVPPVSAGRICMVTFGFSVT